MDRILIRKLVNNIFSESQYINTMMELADRKNPDSAIALSQDEFKEILIMLSQADYLKDYLKEHGMLSIKDEINNRSVKEIVQLLANNLISEETGYDLITNLLNANTDTKPNTGTEEKTVERNEPLTWDELRTMEGKPVWVEIEDYIDKWEIASFRGETRYEKRKEWMLVEDVYHSLARLKRINGRAFMAWKKMRKTAWQAYRKERE